ncbi:NAD(P)-binding domain-containing protein [Streptomyces lavendulae]|uniref:NAD(P)-binding domain-containing protein n=1 Tax=Streptomyces lavendulae TaxID=1914 RepID=UPI0037177756
MTHIHELLVIGSGPYGLSIGAHAAAAGVDVCVLGHPMAAWRENMPKGMLLKSEPRASNLSEPSGLFSFSAYCTSRGLASEHGRPTPLTTFSDYGLWFAQHVVPEVEETTVTALTPDGSSFRAITKNGESLRAQTVAVAVGMLPFRNYPMALRELAAERYSHSSDHKDLSSFNGQDVTVVGGGQGALETATLLAELGARPQLVARTERLTWNPPPASLNRSRVRTLREPFSGLGTGWRNWLWSEHPEIVHRLPAERRSRMAASAFGPAGAWWLRDRFHTMKIPTLTGHRVARARTTDAGRIRLTLSNRGGRKTYQETDHVIAATGFVADLNKLDMLSTDLRSSLEREPGGLSPKLNRVFESSHPRLFFAGLLAVGSFGPSMRFVQGTEFAARRVVRGVRRTLGHSR